MNNNYQNIYLNLIKESNDKAIEIRQAATTKVNKLPLVNNKIDKNTNNTVSRSTRKVDGTKVNVEKKIIKEDGEQCKGCNTSIDTNSIQDQADKNVASKTGYCGSCLDKLKKGEALPNDTINESGPCGCENDRPKRKRFSGINLDSIKARPTNVITTESDDIIDEKKKAADKEEEDIVDIDSDIPEDILQELDKNTPINTDKDNVPLQEVSFISDNQQLVDALSKQVVKVVVYIQPDQPTEDDQPIMIEIDTDDKTFDMLSVKEHEEEQPPLIEDDFDNEKEDFD